MVSEKYPTRALDAHPIALYSNRDSPSTNCDTYQVAIRTSGTYPRFPTPLHLLRKAAVPDWDCNHHSEDFHGLKHSNLAIYGMLDDVLCGSLHRIWQCGQSFYRRID